MGGWEVLRKKENENKVLKRGDRVSDSNGHKGVVVKIVKGTDNQNHGTIYVWQEDRYSYGADNCEHYAEINWKSSLKILDEEA